MDYQNIFKRYELKYIITMAQYKSLLETMQAYMLPDKYGKSLIANIYYDTQNRLLVRRSLEKPQYKEKLRVRSYGVAKEESTVFVEIKKKYKGIVYKRRLDMTQCEASEYLNKNAPSPVSCQIAKEISYFKSFYGEIVPSAYIAYYRKAYYGISNANFRVTFDENIVYRDYDLSLKSSAYGTELLDAGTVLMEVKTALGLPAWLLQFFSENKIYKTSFSKYGSAYKDMVAKQSGGINNVA